MYQLVSFHSPGGDAYSMRDRKWQYEIKQELQDTP